MTRIRAIIAGAATALVLSVASAFAVPVGPMNPAGGLQIQAQEAQEAQVMQVQGRGMCLVGQYPYQRYVPCRDVRRGYNYRSRNEDRCAVVYNQCYAQFGRGSGPYYRCMRSRNC